MTNKKGQIGPRGFISILVLAAILLFFIIPLFNLIINSISGANLDSSLSAIVDALVPLLIIIMIFEFIRRFFR